MARLPPPVTMITCSIPLAIASSTPYWIVGLMEWASHKSLDGLLPENETTVGYEVHVRHLAPARPGTTVVATSKLTEVKGNKLYFDVECHEGDKLLGSGTHKRAIVPADF